MLSFWTNKLCTSQLLNIIWFFLTLSFLLEFLFCYSDSKPSLVFLLSFFSFHIKWMLYNLGPVEKYSKCSTLLSYNTTKSRQEGMRSVRIMRIRVTEKTGWSNTDTRGSALRLLQKHSCKQARLSGDWSSVIWCTLSHQIWTSDF